MKVRTAKKHRFSVSLGNDIYQQVFDLANRNNVSVSWIVRYSLINLLREQAQRREGQLPLPLSEFNGVPAVEREEHRQHGRTSS